MRRALIGVALITLVFAFLFDLVRVRGNSMSPTYCDGDILVSTWPMVWGGTFAKRLSGKIVVAGDSTSLVVKRVVGVPADRLEIRSGVLKVNGKPQNEPYICKQTINPYFSWPSLGDAGWERGYVEVQRDHLFLLGDARAMSKDSMEYGAVERKYVTGVIVGRVKSALETRCECQSLK